MFTKIDSFGVKSDLRQTDVLDDRVQQFHHVAISLVPTFDDTIAAMPSTRQCSKSTAFQDVLLTKFSLLTGFRPQHIPRSRSISSSDMISSDYSIAWHTPNGSHDRHVLHDPRTYTFPIYRLHQAVTRFQFAALFKGCVVYFLQKQAGVEGRVSPLPSQEV